MKHQQATLEALDLLLNQAGVEVGDQEARVVVKHLVWMLRQNETINLTAIRDPEEALRLHAVDSLTALPEVASGPPGAMLDIGTGGGYPGLPLAVAAHRQAVLIDSVGKKARAVAEFIEAESLGGMVEARACRAEELASEQPSRFAVVVARAVSSLASLVELAAPNLCESGILVAMKGPIAKEEIDHGCSAAKLCGMAYERSRTLLLPGGDEGRTLLVFRKSGRPGVSLPRRVGLAQHKPLG